LRDRPALRNTIAGANLLQHTAFAPAKFLSHFVTQCAGRILAADARKPTSLSVKKPHKRELSAKIRVIVGSRFCVADDARPHLAALHKIKLDSAPLIVD
jgi:hypothetical protein